MDDSHREEPAQFDVPDDVLPPASVAVVTELEKLVTQREQGSLSDAEFDEKKSHLLGR